MKTLKQVSMSDYTSLKAGGTAETLVVCDTVGELKDVLMAQGDGGFVFLGNGTNTLFAEEEYRGLVIKLGEAFDFVDIKEGGVVIAGGGTLLSSLANKVAKESLTGLEFAGGIPGSVGGAVFMNAGAYDGEIKNVISSVKALVKDAERGEWEEKVLYKDELDLSYRHSKLMELDAIVLEAEFELSKGDPEAIKDKMKDFSNRRQTKQPLEYPSAGSFFKRPPGMFAGKLIQDAGLAGMSVGGAQVSEKHCGFIINTGGATPKDILDLMEKVQKEVKEKFQVELEPEIRIIREG